MLVGKYIPNLIAKPFDVSREYAQTIYDQTSSPKLDKVHKKWEQEKWASAENRQKLAYIILVELLAYQFTSPVRWIQTQDLLFTTFNFERLVELGPSLTLTGMATRTLKTKYETLDGSVSRNRSILCHAKNAKEIYYQYEDEIEAPASDVTADVPIAATPAAPVTTSTIVSTPSTGPVASMEDVPIKAIDILLVLGLMHPLLFSIFQVEPIWTDLNGGMDRLPDLAYHSRHCIYFIISPFFCSRV